MISFPESITESGELEPGLDAQSITKDFVRKLYFEVAKFPGVASLNDQYLALAYAVRDRLLYRWVKSARTYMEGEHRTVIYLSAEYLPGPQLGQNLMYLGIERSTREAMEALGIDLDEILEHEEEPGLGNGGLGRLAACFMDSLATLHFPAIGYGIRYEFGIFDQEIKEGWQVERTDRWLRYGNPWEVRRHDIEHDVGFGGYTEGYVDASGRWRMRWLPERIVKAVPYDTPVLGSHTANANFLRLWSAVAPEEFDLEAFRVGDYRRAVDAKVRSENIAKILYPSDETAAGRQLRLEQQHFFVSSSLQDMLRIMLQKTHVRHLSSKFAIQLNDTHPAIAVPELMRLLMDVHGLGWDEAWTITTQSLSYTNHTLLAEALEVWELPLFARILPRHLEIILEINQRFLDRVRVLFPGDEALLERLSIIGEKGSKTVRMAHLAAAACHTINGVAELHSHLLKTTVLRDFAAVWPERFTNVTNGISQRRFLGLANPGLRSLLERYLGDDFLDHPERLPDLAVHAEEPGLGAEWRAVKLANKQEFARWLLATTGTSIDPRALIDMQCKRMHEYKRQHLNLLHVAWLYDRIRRGDLAGIVPRTVVLAGKAAPAYFMAKLIIRFAHALAASIDADRNARELLRVVFVPDFNVKVAQHMYPAADLSQQISTAGREASGTGNMKFALNGALTIGTLDGANVEIRQAVGADNFFLFGMTAEEVLEKERVGHEPRLDLEREPELAGLLSDIARGRFSPGEPELFVPLVKSLTERDAFFVLSDFRAYAAAQEKVARAWQDPAWWTAASIRNTAGMARFSSDRAIREYAEGIWHVRPVEVASKHAQWGLLRGTVSKTS